jgi:hypothetical protein
VQSALHIELPRYTDARIHSPDLTEIQPVEYRADLVIQLLQSKPVLGIIVEAQLSPDPRKRYVWPAYAANLRAQLECPALVLVVTDKDSVAKWAATPVNMGGRNTFTPLVIGPSGVPEVVDEAQAQADPELAVLSAMAHGRDRDVTRSLRIAMVAQRVCQSLDIERASIYFDLIHHSLDEAARQALRDMMPAKYEYQSDFARHYYGQGKTEGRIEGRAEGTRELLTRQLNLRFGPLDEHALARLASASIAELEGIAERLLTAPTLDEALGPGEPSPTACTSK